MQSISQYCVVSFYILSKIIRDATVTKLSMCFSRSTSSRCAPRFIWAFLPSPVYLSPSSVIVLLSTFLPQEPLDTKDSDQYQLQTDSASMIKKWKLGVKLLKCPSFQGCRSITTQMQESISTFSTIGHLHCITAARIPTVTSAVDTWPRAKQPFFLGMQNRRHQTHCIRKRHQCGKQKPIRRNCNSIILLIFFPFPL